MTDSALITEPGSSSEYAIEGELDQLTSNVAKYADLTGNELDIELSLDGKVLRVNVTDSGRPFDPTLFATPPVPRSLAEITPGGLGIHLVRSFSRSFRWRRENGRNVVHVELDV